MKVVYMCHGGFKIRGLGSGPLLKMGWGVGFQNWPTREKVVLELQITKKHVFFFFEDLFELHRSNNWSLYELPRPTIWGLSRSTYTYCPNMGVTPPSEKLHCSWTSSDILRFQPVLTGHSSPVTDNCPYRITFEALGYVLYMERMNF